MPLVGIIITGDISSHNPCALLIDVFNGDGVYRDIVFQNAIAPSEGVKACLGSVVDVFTWLHDELDGRQYMVKGKLDVVASCNIQVLGGEQVELLGHVSRNRISDNGLVRGIQCHRKPIVVGTVVEIGCDGVEVASTSVLRPTQTVHQVLVLHIPLVWG